MVKLLNFCHICENIAEDADSSHARVPSDYLFNRSRHWTEEQPQLREGLTTLVAFVIDQLERVATPQFHDIIVRGWQSWAAFFSFFFCGIVLVKFLDRALKYVGSSLIDRSSHLPLKFFLTVGLKYCEILCLLIKQCLFFTNFSYGQLAVNRCWSNWVNIPIHDSVLSGLSNFLCLHVLIWCNR